MPALLRSCLLIVLAAVAVTECRRLRAEDGAAAVYLDRARPVDERVDDLVGRMTLEEKISQMQNDAPAIPRLHVESYNWWNEALHGVARSGYATVFPQAIGMAATWDTRLMERVGDAIAMEGRAKYNAAQREGNHAIFYGLTFWSPNINIDRDPRWGRGQETYGEDPFLTGQIGSAFVRGLQGDRQDAPKVIATAKHFAVHSGPETERHGFDAVVSVHDLADTYLPAFRELVMNAHVDSVMCAYNAIDGEPACANPGLLEKTLRRDWKFPGFIVSDCAAITDVTAGHKFAPDMAHAAAASVKAGTDLSCGKEYGALKQAVVQGLITEAEIDVAVKRLFRARMMLGMFGAGDARDSVAASEIDSAAHRELALEAARRSIVLLKNAGSALPLTGKGTVAVIGPNAATVAALEGNYNAVATHPVTPLAALQARATGRVAYAQGAPYVEGAMLPVPETAFSTEEKGTVVPGLAAEYFDGEGFDSKPVERRVDRAIDFDWNGAAPVKGLGREAFAVRWTGRFTPVSAGATRFGFTLAHCSTCNDFESIRVWLDGKLAYDFRHDATPGRHGPTPGFEMPFDDVRAHDLRVEYVHKAPLFGAGLTFTWQPSPEAERAQAVAAAQKADVVLAFLGLSPELEGEEMPVEVQGFRGGDRTAIELPQVQQKLMDALAATGKPVVIVLMSGGAVALGKAAEQAAAVLEAWYPGEAGGTAIADTLFGENNPSGRLPVTFYASTKQLPEFTDYSMAHRTYRYFDGAPLYPFGFGLSYSDFRYSDAELSSSKVSAGDPLFVTTDVTNKSRRDGEEVVEVYLVPPAGAGGPRAWLAGFQHVAVEHGRRVKARVEIDPRRMSIVGQDGVRRIVPGEYTMWIGAGQPHEGSGVALSLRIEGTSELAP